MKDMACHFTGKRRIRKGDRAFELGFQGRQVKDLQFGKGINRRRLENVYSCMHDIQILQQHPKKVLESLNRGEIERMELAVEQITDEFMVYGFLCFGYRVAPWWIDRCSEQEFSRSPKGV